jgi:ABC-type Fe3+-hydroxamate transport system substrate-binding protein
MIRSETPCRIVSLVPSLTEALIGFGLGECLVGRTRYCVEPRDRVASVEVVGGTKNPDLERIIALAPDLVVLNREENRREDWEALTAAQVPVWVSHPRSVAEAADMLEDLGRAVGARRQGEDLAGACRAALQQVQARVCTQRRARRPSVFCPIWRNPWMTFRPSTYVGSMLDAVGLKNVFSDAAATDFFAVELEDALARRPDIILLPDEPYAFSAKHADELRACGAKSVILQVDGKDLSWYGPRIPRALERLWTITADISGI